MKIKLILFLLIGTFAIASAQTEEKGWDEGVAAIFVEVTPHNFNDIPSIYVGNLAKAWGKKYVHTNTGKNLFSLYGTTFLKKRVAFPTSVIEMLEKDKSLKAFLSKKKLVVINGKGEIIKKMKR